MAVPGVPVALVALALALPLAASGAAAETGDDVHPALTYFAHRPSGAVFSSAQTPDGYLWFGTMSGLYRFDGVRFVRFSPDNTPALSHPRIYHLAVTTDGRLWIASGEAGAASGDWERGGPGLVVHERGVFRRVTRDEGLPDEWVLSLAAAAGNKLWIGTRKGLVLWQGNRGEALGAPEHSDGRVFHVRPDDTGRVWIGSSAGFARYEGGRFTVEAEKVFPLFSSRGPRGTLWMTNLHTVFRLAPGDKTWVAFAEASALTMHSIRTVAEDMHGRLWVGGSGVAQVDIATRAPSRVLALDAAADPNSSLVLSLFLDNEGSMWVGTREGGVFQGAPARVLNFGTREGVPGDVGFALLHRRDGTLLLSFGGGVVRVQGNTLARLPHKGDAPKVVARSLAETTDGSVWLATREPFIYRWANDTFARMTVTRNGGPGNVDTVIGDDAGGLWVAWQEGGLSHYESVGSAAEDGLGGGRFFDESAGACAGQHLSAAKGADGRMWFGNYVQGITGVAGGAATCYREAGLAKGTVLGLFEDDDGALFAGVHAAPGLFRLRAGRFVRYTHGLDTSVYGITKDDHGNLWFGSAAGAYKVKRSDLDAADPSNARGRIPWLRFAHVDGLRSEESFGGTSPAAAYDAGRFWFPTLRGFSAVVDPAHLAPLPLIPPVVERVQANHIEFPGHRPAQVPPGRGNLTIEYTSPSFTLPRQLSFEYLLEGFDKEWVLAQGRRTAYYTNVPPGKYVFRVRVRRGDGAPVEGGQPLQLALRPFFYQTTAFYAGLALALAAAGLAVHRMRLRQVDARHALVHTERARLARELHDHLGQGFTAIGFALDALRAKLRGNDTGQIAEQARGLLEHCQIETRRLVWDLRSEAERIGDVGAALRQVVERARVAGGPSIKFDSDGEADVSGLAQHELPLIAQEAVTNALRHAQATVVTVSLRSTGDTLTMTVTDDGKGFPPRPGGGAPTLPGHFGLVGMEERARRLQARLQIHSAPGAGTEVLVTVPRTSKQVSPPAAS